MLGVASGLVTGSQAIIFDGMYSFVDVVPTVVSLLVVKLIARGASHRFQYGYWHLEPLVAVLRDAILAVACIYAAVDAINALSSGGHDVEYGLAALWAGILCVIGLAMTLFLRRRARLLQSPMLEVDARSWVVSTMLEPRASDRLRHRDGLGGHRISGLDSVSSMRIALLSMALIMLPMPIIGLWRSMSDVLQVAPDELDARVQEVMDSVLKERAFPEYSSYIAKAGRGRFVEIHVLVRPGIPDRYRDGRCDPARSFRRLNAATPKFWLTIDFTAERRWM